jgi:hypothetical protein
VRNSSQAAGDFIVAREDGSNDFFSLEKPVKVIKGLTVREDTRLACQLL